MRYAIYYSPPEDDLLHKLGSSWLGRDAYNNESVEQPSIAGIKEATAEPARYGFHATLKPPFQLKHGIKRALLGEAVGSLARRISAVAISNLVLRAEHGFIALVPEKQQRTVSILADHCVREIDEFRSPIDAIEIARRRKVGLSAKQDEYLHAWGYPYVFEEFRFHLTLTGHLPTEDIARLLPLAGEHFAPVLNRSLKIDCLTIFMESGSSQPFIVEEQFPIGSTNNRKAVL